jgi:hypothetical protein
VRLHIVSVDRVEDQGGYRYRKRRGNGGKGWTGEKGGNNRQMKGGVLGGGGHRWW